MKRLLLLFPLFLGAGEDFISHYEYGEMLYNNPRGVSCAECHGKSGEGRVIVTYENTRGKGVLSGPDIRRSTLKKMIESSNASHKIMPRYYMTDEEVQAIYDYLKERNAEYLADLNATQS